ncbi:hypothetical protein Y032_0810g2461 [Ancylostoma ceylanicum]|uniref:Peptidase M12A domain-containing protein n=1 Tax=Ancylostoma ceylanicum TaxID=53326 RepID=A0A016WD97_9BILA|nr:hypothetical protein Y032_0810g2461 [Ancylostoma ceylanicum]
MSAIKADWIDQFEKKTPQTNENYGITYDFGSIMHYGGTSASFNKKPTMVPSDPMHQETLGSAFVSFYDLLVLNNHYKCFDKCKGNAKAAKCEMGGVPHPRDCSKCLCPGGYGGQFCDKRPSGCGDVLKATKEYTDLSKTIGDPNMKEKEDFEICYYWIELRNLGCRLLQYSRRGLKIKHVSKDVRILLNSLNSFAKVQ